MTRALAVAAVLAAVVAGCNDGPREAGPVPTAKPGMSSASTGEATGPPTTSAPSTRLCQGAQADVEIASQEGAAGTIGTTWKVTNGSSAPCRSFGYPGMDFHAASGWLNVRVHRGGIETIDETPSTVVLGPGQSLYFVSFWGDVDTEAGPCTRFDRVKVTLPDNFTSVRVATSGCVDPGLVRVGPVRTSPPS